MSIYQGGQATGCQRVPLTGPPAPEQQFLGAHTQLPRHALLMTTLFWVFASWWSTINVDHHFNFPVTIIV